MTSIKLYKGAGSSTVLFNSNGRNFYEGAGSSKALFTVSGTKLYRGAGTSNVVCNWSGDSLGTSDIAAVVWLIDTP